MQPNIGGVLTNFPIRTNTCSSRLGAPCPVANQPPSIMCTRMGPRTSWMISRWLRCRHMGSAGKPVVSTSNNPSPPLLQPPTSRGNRPKALKSEAWALSPADLTSAEPQFSRVLRRSLQVLARATQFDPWPRRPGVQGSFWWSVQVCTICETCHGRKMSLSNDSCTCPT